MICGSRVRGQNTPLSRIYIYTRQNVSPLSSRITSHNVPSFRLYITNDMVMPNTVYVHRNLLIRYVLSHMNTAAKLQAMKSPWTYYIYCTAIYPERHGMTIRTASSVITLATIQPPHLLTLTWHYINTKASELTDHSHCPERKFMNQHCMN